MANLSKLPLHDEALTEACSWIAKIDRGITAGEEIALKQWLSDGADNRKAILKTAKLWDSMDTLSRLSDIFPRRTPNHDRLMWSALAIAASIILAVTVGFLSTDNQSGLKVGETQTSASIVTTKGLYETALGEHSTVILQDDSQVTLNTSSLIRVHYSDHQRLIILERGEIHVQVSRDESRPLSVLAGSTIVQAVGTAFNIELSSNKEVELTVTQGSVLVGGAKGNIGEVPEIPFELAANSLSVSAGQAVILGSLNEEISVVNSDEIEVRLAWRDGNIIFRGETLGEAVDEISRYTAVKFFFLDDTAKQVRVAGRYKVDDVDGLLAALAGNFAISYERTVDNRIFLSSSTPQ